MIDRIIFIADAFAADVPGGGELNNDVLIQMFKAHGTPVNSIHSSGVIPPLIENHSECKFIVANFTGLNPLCRAALRGKKYIIYEHDHKYLKSRNPADFKDYVAPSSEIINQEFYKEAAAVICQSSFHANIVKKNLNLDNIVSVGGNLWSDDILAFLKEVSSRPKNDKCAVMVSNNWHKNTAGSIAYCEKHNLEFELVQTAPYKEFLSKLGENKKLVFFPQTPETLSRIVVEARMMGMSVITNNQVGATQEEWFKYKGVALVNVMKNKKIEIFNLVKGLLDGK